MKVLVTGASSLLGTHVILDLLGAGYTVRALARRPERMAVENSRLEIARGDIRDAAALSRAVSGCSAVIHLAADTSPLSRPYARHRAVNVQGTRNVLETARRAGVSRFLYVSTANTIGYGSPGMPATEAEPMRFPFTRSGYARSKQEAEQLVLASGEHSAMEVAVFNPCFLIGAYDRTPSSGRILLRASGKRFVTVPPGGKNFLAARDAARAIVAGLTRAGNGERYLLAGENHSYLDFYREMRRATGERFRIIVLPRWVLLAAGMAGSMLAACGRANVFHLTNMRILCITGYYNSRKAREALDTPETPLGVAIAEAVAWFRATGRLPVKTPALSKNPLKQSL